MASENIELNREATKERLYTFTYASAIIDAASAGNMAWFRDSVINAAKAYGVDLNETDDHAKTKEAYKKAFQEDLAARGILKKSGTFGGYVLSDDPKKRQEFSTLIYSVRCRKQEMELASSAWAFTKRALKAKEGTLSIIAKELELGPKAVQKIGTGLLVTITTLQELDNYKDNILSEVRSRVARDILNLDDQEIVRSIFSNQQKENELLNEGNVEEEKTKHGPEDVVSEFKFGSKIWKQATKEAKKRIKGLTRIEGPTVMEAHLSDENKEELLNEAHAKFEGIKDQEDDGVVRRCADFMKKPVFSQAGIMLDAYMDIDKEVNPDGRATFSVEKMKIGVRSAAAKTNYALPPLVSLANLTIELTKDLTLGSVSRLQLALSSVIHKGYSSKSIDVQAVSRFANQFLCGIDYAASYIAKKIIPVGDFSKAQYDIRHFNIKEVDEHKRGENFAKTYASLDIYRAGKAEYIVGAFGVFNMRPRDCLWAMAYLTAGINATRNGVVYDLPKDEKIGNKRGITEDHVKSLDKKAMLLYEKYENLALKMGYEAALQKMKDEFITLHHAAISKSEKMRAHMGLEPLSKVTHFNRMYDNAPVKEYDYIRVKDLTKEEYKKGDLNKVFEEYDAVYIEDDYTGALQLEEERKIVVASLDEQNRAVSIECTPEILNLETKEHNLIDKRVDTIETVEDTGRILLKNDAMRAYQKTFESIEIGERAGEKWRVITKALLKTDEYTTFYDEATKEYGIKDNRTEVDLKFASCEPNVMLNDRCVSVKRFALDIQKKELENICKSCRIDERDIQEIADRANTQSSAERNIMTRVDKEGLINDFDSSYRLLKGDLNVDDTLVNVDKRCAAVEHMTDLIGRKEEAKEIICSMEKELDKYRELAKTDPILALCRTVEPECERHGEFITLSLSDGTEFAINQHGKLAEFCDELDDNICNLQYTFKRILIEARDLGADLQILPDEDRDMDSFPTQDIDDLER